MDSLPRLLGPFLERPVEWRAAPRILVVGPVSIPRLTVSTFVSAELARVVFESSEAVPFRVQQEAGRVTVAVARDLVDVSLPPSRPAGGIVESVQFLGGPENVFAVVLGPRFQKLKATEQESPPRLVLELAAPPLAPGERAPAAAPAVPTGEPATWRTRPRVPAGTVYEYNDTRINVLALSLQNVWRRPLPEVLHELVMDPIGASPTWRWIGYDNSWIALDGHMVQAVGGGGHWGGGMFIKASDQARLGLLTLWRGKWGDRQIFSEEWFRKATTPGPANKGYGYCNYFLNSDQASLPSAPASAFTHRGNGANIIYVDPANDLVVVTRWIPCKKVREETSVDD